jgi:hypothetical protein
MALTAFQLDVLRHLALARRERGESYVAGGVALNQLLRAPRLSRDIDVFHDTESALARTWAADRQLLELAGCVTSVVRESPSFVEAMVSRGPEGVLMQWTRDSAYRFFPLIEDDLLGLALHPFDLATNKVLAMAGRLEARDWIDVMTCEQKLQPLGFLVWAACGKDPGYNPSSLLAEISRSHYSQAELDTLAFEGSRPNAVQLGTRWHEVLRSARATCDALPADELGACVVTRGGNLYTGDAAELATALSDGTVVFHRGRIGGSWPTLRKS